jgi:hypothetical protein
MQMQMVFPIRRNNNTNTNTNNTNNRSYNTVDVSPFAQFGSIDTNEAASTFGIYLEPIRNAYYKTYHHVITFDAYPQGPLGNMVVHVNTPPLSEFQTMNALSPPPFTRSGGGIYGQCKRILSRFPKGSRYITQKHPDAYMTPRDIPAVYGFLRANGYTVNTELTKMTYESKVSEYMSADETYSGGAHKKLIAIVEYNPSM